MAKEAKFQVRVDVDLLDFFDSVVGHGNRSKRIVGYMEAVVTNSQRYEDYLRKKKKELKNGTNSNDFKGG